MESIFKKEFYTKQRILTFLLTFFVGLLIYSLLISEQLVNTFDGLWNGSFYVAGKWEVSCGRFVWPFLDKARACICSDPYMSVISLAVLSCSMVLADALLGVDKVTHAVLLNLTFLANVAICVFLSYRFMAPTFAFSVFFAVLTVVFLQMLKRPWNILAAGVTLMLSMGLYQANVGCTCILILGILILWILQNKEVKAIMRFLADSVLAAVFGGVLYVVFLKVFLALFHTQMASYHGGSDYSVLGAIVNFPGSILRVYDQFVQYFFKDQFLVVVYSRFHSLQILSTIFSLLAVCCMLVWIIKYKTRGMVASAVLLLLPMASSVILFVVTDGGNSIQMTGPQALVVPLLFSLVVYTAGCLDVKRLAKAFSLAAVLATGLFAYAEGLQVCMDQSEMLEGTRATTWMYNSTVEDLKDENLIDKEYAYLYYGSPADNGCFLKSKYYLYSNDYAKVGQFWLGGDCAAYTWTGVRSNFGGIDLKIAEYPKYEEVRQDTVMMSEIASMPVFPEEGYIRQFGNLVVVKISEHE